MNFAILVPIVIFYLVIMSGLAYYGYRSTKSNEDYLVGGRNTNAIIMALSYGATFTSSSALIGFGGVAAMNGFGIIWLAFLNILVGVFIAFAVFGKRIRKLSVNLEAYTFSELLGKHYQSKFITILSGIFIFIFMPAYTSVVLIGGGRFLEQTLSIDYNIGLLLLAVIVGIYVIGGGIKAVLYTDAFAAAIMLIGMAIFLFMSYQAVGGIVDGHSALTSMKNLVPDALFEQGHRGWTSMPAAGSPMWWTLVSTIIMGVGIGVLAQPQLTMRFMTVKNNKAMNRSVLVGGVFMFFMTGAAYMIGPISNVYFYKNDGEIAINLANGNPDLVIPMFISEIMPEWFVYLFTLTLISAVISTISSLIHLQGSAFGQDILSNLGVKSVLGMDGSRMGVLIGLAGAVILSYVLPGGVIAQATAFWFGICAAGFLPTMIGAFYWKRATKQGAIASIFVGFLVSVIGFLFLHAKEATAIGLSRALFGKDTLFAFPLTHIDPLIYSLPLSTIVFIVVSLVSKSKEHSLDVSGQDKVV